MAYIKVDAFDVVINGVEYTGPDTYVELKDESTGYTGPGSYHVQVQAGGVLGYSFVVTQGLAPGDSSTRMTLGRVVLTPTGEMALADKRKVNVNAIGVNATILQDPVDGSYLADDVVLPRNIQGGVSALLDELGTAEGDLAVRGSTGWEALTPGTSGDVLTSNGTGAVPSWQPSSGGGGGVTSLNSETGAITIESTGSSLAVSEPDSSHINVDLAAITNDSVLANTSGSSAIPVATTVPALLDTIDNTRGDILYRGASGWAALGPGTSGNVLTTHGAGSDPTWSASGGGGSGTVTSISQGTGIAASPNPITTTGTIALAPASDKTIKSNISGSSAAPTDNSLTAILDDIIGSSKGTLVYRDASVWQALSPGSTGQVLAMSSGGIPAWQSASSVPGAGGTDLYDWSAGTGSLGSWTQVGISGTTSITNNGTKSITVADTGANSASLRGCYRVLPSTPYLVAVCVQTTGVMFSWGSAFVGFTDGTKYELIRIQVENIEYETWSNSTTRSGFLGYTAGYPAAGYAAPLWFGLKDDGTNYSLLFGLDGANWATVKTGTKSGGFLGGSGYTNAAWGLNTDSSTTAMAISLRCYDTNGLSRVVG